MTNISIIDIFGTSSVSNVLMGYIYPYNLVLKATCKPLRQICNRWVAKTQSFKKYTMAVPFHALMHKPTSTDCAKYIMMSLQAINQEKAVIVDKRKFAVAKLFNQLMFIGAIDEIREASRILLKVTCEFCLDVNYVSPMYNSAFYGWRECSVDKVIAAVHIFNTHKPSLQYCANMLRYEPNDMILKYFPGEILAEFFRINPSVQLYQCMTPSLTAEYVKTLRLNRDDISMIITLYLDGHMELSCERNIPYNGVTILNKFADKKYLQKHINISKLFIKFGGDVQYCDMVSKMMFHTNIFETYQHFDLSANSLCEYMTTVSIAPDVKINAVPMATYPTNLHANTPHYVPFTALWPNVTLEEVCATCREIPSEVKLRFYDKYKDELPLSRYGKLAHKLI